jgi:multiple sugar transport system ATP-binding protein
LAKVELIDLTKVYDKTEVLHGINLTVQDGEFVVLVGPSGCGKSTSLRMIAGLEEISGGEVKIAGRQVNNVAPKDRDIAMVFQNYAIYPHMSVRKNIGFGLRTSTLPKDQKERRIDEVADILSMTDLLDRRPSQLSGGQRQRVAIGRAMVRDPSVFLFDEPLSNLDAQLRTQMRLEIKKLHQRVGTTVIFVTHDQVEAMTLADRIVVMKDGYIQQVGTPSHVYEKPANTFVARFIGAPSMNMIPGNLTETGVTLNNNVSLALANVPNGNEVILGVRPNDLVVAGDINKSEAIFEGKISVIEPLGAETLVYADVGGQEMIATAPGRRPPRVGDIVEFAAAMDTLHLFDAASGIAIS